MIAGRIKRAIVGFVLTVLLGVSLFGMPLAIWGAFEAWKEPIILYGKSRGQRQTIVGRAAECFYVGGFVGGCAGAIAGVGVATVRLLHKGPLKRD